MIEMRKVMAVALAAALAVPAALAYDFKVGAVDYNFVSNRKAVNVTYEELGQGAYSGKVRIPYEVSYQMQSLPVKGVGDFAFLNSQMMDTCELPEGVTSIGQQAFSHCYYMTSVSLPSTLRTLKDYAFEYCEDMPALHLPASLAQIGEGVFYDCLSLAEFTIDEENTHFCTPGGVLYTTGNTELVCYPVGRQSLTYTVAEGTTVLRDYSFAKARLEHITLPVSLEKIGDVTFMEAISFKSVASLNPVPPVGQEIIFEPSVYSNAVLYVPQESIEAYRSAEGWSQFRDIRGIDASTAVVESEAEINGPVYTLTGVKVADSAEDIATLPAGLYVVSGKVIVKK
ncbi:MAG: leucine-rich repeat domain-containing protein [Paramuribaculum sp.]|nr:leucine-rich repeat domain-containing protein [Paramuribaculum sp.]